MGEQAILQQLRELSGHEPLVRDAERLLRGAAPEGSYIAREGRWFPELLPDSVQETKIEAEPEATPEQAESRERARMLLEELARRMIALEKSVEQLGEKLTSSIAQLSSMAANVDLAAAARAQTEQAIPAARPPTAAVPAVGAAAGVGAATAAQPAAAGHAAAASAGGHEGILLPAATALTDLIRGLAGPDANLTPCDRTDWAALVAGGAPVFFAVVQNNAGDEAGSMLFDLEAALRLAGALLMESEEMIESLLEEKIMSDEMNDAASEVCNTLTSALNKVGGNPHLRSGKLQPFTEARAAQLATAAKRDDYRYNQGGRFSLVAS
jgi:hypothetical protein